MSFIIRKAENEDISQIAELLGLLFSSEHEFSANINLQKNGITDIISNPAKGEFIIIEKDSIVIGTITILYTVSTALGGKTAIFEDFFIKKEFRNQGFGKKLFSFVMDYVQKKGCLRITLLTDFDNLPAQNFYKSMGFFKSEMIPMRFIF